MKVLGIPSIVIIVALGLSSCMGTSANQDLLPRASGKAGEIILVMDSVHRNTELGNELDQILRKQVVGLPRPEPEFNIRYVLPEAFNSILKRGHNIIILAVLENYSKNSEIVKNYFTANSIQRINEEPDLYHLSKQNEWARGQEVLFLFGKTEEELQKNLAENRDRVRAHFNTIERRRLMASLYKSKELKEVGNVLMENHQFSLRMPFGWRIEFEDPNTNFIWLRLPGIEIDRNIWVYYEEYTSEVVFEDLTAFRNKVTKQYIFDDKEKNDTSYVVVETLIPPVETQVSFNDKFAIESRGLWKTNNFSMGGPFLGYMFVDQELNRVYYVDGFVYSPGKDQRELIRELETIIWTFRTESEASPAS
jgi:hypothetical protein